MENNNERVPCGSRYNYYNYYNINKLRYKLYYQEKKEREKEAEKTKQDKDYLKDYWKYQLYNEENLKNYNMYLEVFLGVICVIAFYVTWQIVKHNKNLKK